MRRVRALPNFPVAQSGIPVTLTATAASATQINLVAAYGGQVPPVSYSFYILSGFAWTLIATQSSGTYTSGGLTTGQTYYYQVTVTTLDGRTSMPSPVASATPLALSPTATPSISPASGSYTGTQTITITDATSGATIYYTTNGTTPSTSSTPYTGTFTVSATTTVKAIAVASGYGLSTVASATYTIGTGGSLSIPAVTLPNATVGGTYFYQLTATGGQPPYQWGQIGPNYFGGFNYSVNVPVSAITQTTNAVFTLTSSATSNPFTGQTQVMVYPYAGSWPKSLYTSGAITALGGSQGAWTVTTNIDFSNSSYGSNLLNCALVAGPTGVNPYQLTLTGCLEVVPTVAETASLPIIVTDNTGATATVTLSLTSNSTLAIMGCDLSKSTQALPPAMQYNAYKQQMTCAGGTGSGQSWTFSGLPVGLTGSSAGVISGIPTGTSNYTGIAVTVTDSAGPPVSAVFTLEVAPNANVARPSYNTGTGFFVANGQLYDPNGAPFRMRGINQNHYGTTPINLAQTMGANTIRMFSYLLNNGGYPPSTTAPSIAAMVTAGILPVFAISAVPGVGIANATITGTAGQFSCAATNLPILVGQTVNISGTGSGTGSISGYSSNGVNYLVSATNGSTTFTLTTTSGGALTTVAGTTTGWTYNGGPASNGTNVVDLQVCANWIAANYSAYHALTVFNICNEWNGTDANWQTGYKNAVSTIRAAGCTNPLMIDANGDGQHALTLVNYAAAIQAADPQQNCIFSHHVYGDSQNIQAQITGITTGSTNTVIQINYTGPYNPFQNYNTGTGNGLPSTIYVSGVAGMTQINGLTLNTVTATANGNPGAYSVTVSLNSSSFSAYTGGGTLYSGVHISQVVTPELAALATSNVCCVFGEVSPGKNIGTNAASPTTVTNAQTVAAAEANNLGWLYWAIDDNNLGSNSSCQNWFGAQLNNGGSTAYTNLTYVGLDAAYNPNTGINALASPASSFVGGSALPTTNFSYFIAPNGDDNNAGTLSAPWSITALNTKQSTYRGTNVGIIGDIGGTQTPITYGQVGGVKTTLYSLMNSAGNSGNQPVLNVDGGTSTLSTYIASCNSSGVYTPRWAIIDPSNSGSYSTNGTGILFGQRGASATQVPHPGYVTFDGLTIRNFVYAAIDLEYTSRTAGVVIQNCEIYGGSCPTSANNPGAIRYQGTSGIVIHNNKIHDLAVTGGGGSPVWGLNAIMAYGTTLSGSDASVITNNTTYNCNSILQKDGFSDFANCSYNYLDHGNFGSAANTDSGVAQGSVVSQQPNGGVTSVFHHNICLGMLWFVPQSAGHTFTGTYQVYNNTFYGTSNYPQFWTAKVSTGASGAAFQFYQNLVYAASSYLNSGGLGASLYVEISTISVANSTLNNNVYGNGMTWGTVNDVILPSFAQWKTNTGCDASSVVISSSPFTGTPTAQSPSSFATNSNAVIGSTTCGASDGSGTIGCNF